MVNQFDSIDPRYSLWEDINHILVILAEEGKEKFGIGGFTSPYVISCLDWFEKLGYAIQNNDTKKQNHYLFNIEHFTVEGFEYYSRITYQLKEVDNEVHKFSVTVMISAMILRNILNV